MNPGIGAALVALVCWGIGDFLIQRSTRKFGDGIALFFITAFAAIVLFPFVSRDLLEVLHAPDMFPRLILVVAGVVTLGAALFNFESLRQGKISVMEPIFSMEIIITVLFATVLLREQLTLPQGLLILTTMFGIGLISTRAHHLRRRIKLERGLLYALAGTVLMGTANFMFGVSARQTSPLLINWFTSAFIALVVLMYLIARGQWRSIFEAFQQRPGLILGVSIIDNAAWIAFAYSVLHVPIAIATGVSESYVAVAAVLGIVVNREKLQFHQIAGLLLVIICVAALARAVPS